MVKALLVDVRCGTVGILGGGRGIGRGSGGINGKYRLSDEGKENGSVGYDGGP